MYFFKKVSKESIYQTINGLIIKLIPIVALCFGVSSIVVLDAYHNKKYSFKSSLFTGLISLILSSSIGVSIVLMKPEAVYMAIISTSISSLLSRSIVAFLTDDKEEKKLLKKITNKWLVDEK